MLKSHNKLQITLIKNKILLQKREKHGILAKKHSILAKSRHLTKITVSVIFYCPYWWDIQLKHLVEACSLHLAIWHNYEYTGHDNNKTVQCFDICTLERECKRPSRMVLPRTLVVNSHNALVRAGARFLKDHKIYHRIIIRLS